MNFYHQSVSAENITLLYTAGEGLCGCILGESPSDGHCHPSCLATCRVYGTKLTNSRQVQYLLDYCQSCLICLSETWLNDTDPESAIDLEGFSVVQADRNAKSGKSKGGGVCMFKNK